MLTFPSHPDDTCCDGLRPQMRAGHYLPESYPSLLILA